MNNRFEKYNKLSSPEELLEFMQKEIKYGICGNDKKIYSDWDSKSNFEFQHACQSKYFLCDKERILKTGYGTCWDQVELERDFFKSHGYEFKTFFIWFLFDYENNYLTHSYLVYKRNNKYYYFENSDTENRGIYCFNSYKEAITYQMNKHIKTNKKYGNKINNEILKHLNIVEYKNTRLGMNQKEFIEMILNSKVIYRNNSFID